MAAILGLLAVVAGIGSLVCWVMVLIKLFTNGQVAAGVISIFCGIVAFVMGWMNADKWNIKNVMIIWTICILVGIVAQVGIGLSAAGQQALAPPQM
ncbi:MAG: hypothetical protein JNG89_04915 [Planctomycetaceae bacterium]|nr:hypothetical protein [Planctomycetaceae bacterium]